MYNYQIYIHYFRWDTPLTSINDPNDGDFPFGPGEEDCVDVFHTDGGVLIDVPCATDLYKVEFICNMPSELCYLDYYWNIINNTNNHMNYTGCELQSDSTSDEYLAMYMNS